MNNHNPKIVRKSLADEVAEKLQEQISSGYYKLNDKLPIEPELMKTFGVGRSTIREAIKSLVNSGLLRVQQGLGTFVENTVGIKESFGKRLTRAKSEELDEVRQMIEMKIAEKAALNRTKKDLEKINACLSDRFKSAEEGDLEGCIDADIQFHVAIAEASKNKILADLYQSVAHHLRDWFVHNSTNTEMFTETFHLHKNLVLSIEAQDSKKAWQCAAIITGHISQ